MYFKKKFSFKRKKFIKSLWSLFILVILRKIYECVSMLGNIIYTSHSIMPEDTGKIYQILIYWLIECINTNLAYMLYKHKYVTSNMHTFLWILQCNFCIPNCCKERIEHFYVHLSILVIFFIFLRCYYSHDSSV